MLFAHRQSEPVGRWLGIGEDSRGLRVRGQLNRETPAGQKAYSHLKHGDISGLSIGYSIPRGGASHSNGNRILHKLNLHEVSVVATPADPRSRVTGVKSIESRGQLEFLLREMGVPRKAARMVAAGGWPALVGEPHNEEEQRVFAAIVKTLDCNLLELKAMKGKP
jgi:HK97 family phage prohead protease